MLFKRLTTPLNYIKPLLSTLKNSFLLVKACCTLTSLAYTSLIHCFIAKSLTTLKIVAISLLYLRPSILSLRSASFLSVLPIKLNLQLKASTCAFSVSFL
jgi:hypothetical protein